ncbi:MAG: periplasmic heavy metal sensor [Rhizobiales bacterium]|nr:periplasmic heavy metal sensor [Hyphomicrobiales bacterium]
MSDNSTTPPEQKKMGLQPNWMRPALFASLAFNLFVVGLLAAPLLLMPFRDQMMPWHDGDDGHGPERIGDMPQGPERMMRRGLAALDPADRKKMRAIVMESLPLIKERMQDMQQAKLELTQAMSADPYDKEKLEAAFDKMDQAMLNMGRAARESMMKALADMPAEQRKRMAKAMANMDGPVRHRLRDGQRPLDPDRVRRFRERMQERFGEDSSKAGPEAGSDDMNTPDEAPQP